MSGQWHEDPDDVVKEGAALFRAEGEPDVEVIVVLFVHASAFSPPSQDGLVFGIDDEELTREVSQ